MEDLLFLSHRIPFPPNKGDKIRSFHILRQLSRSYCVHLGAFVDTPADEQYIDAVSQYCDETCILNLNPVTARLRSVRGLLRGQPLTLPYYFDRRLQHWVEKTVIETGITRAFVFSSAMAQYLRGPAFESMHRVIDFVDVDSDKWRQYSSKKSWPMSSVYRREAERLLQYDREVAAEFDTSVFVSSRECDLFAQLAPEAVNGIACIENGVDVDYFSPQTEFHNPYPAGDKVLVFIGAMDYWANVDAVTWFARDIFPRIRKCLPAARFCIVGSRPAPAVRQLAQLPGVTVTGPVEDIRPYLAHASIAVATLRIARGVQNKVLEAMAMNKPVLASTAATGSLDVEPAAGLMVSDEEQALADMAVQCLSGPDTTGGMLRNQVCNRYSWTSNLAGIDHLIEGCSVADSRVDARRKAGACDQLPASMS